MKSICLNMIVRNEEGCIARCLGSARPLVSYWVICDTGSTDATRELIREALHGIPGELHQDQWRDFSHNRNLGLARARGKADYHLMIDADFTVNVQAGFDPASLSADGYRIGFEGDIDWRVTRLVSDRHDWSYRGRAHEYIHAPSAQLFSDLPAVSLSHHADGGSGPGRLEKYLNLLLQDHEEEPENARTVFYIAQTYADLGQFDAAVQWYERRLTMGDWGEEQWFAAYMMTRCKQALGRPWPEVLHSYLECYEMRPWRWEPLQRICEYQREMKHYELNYLLSRPALEGGYPGEDMVFIERAVYQYGLLMERALACFWTQRFDEAAELLDRVLGVTELPDNYQRSALKLVAELKRAA
jgi:glycosyltransferase involved in cell wall biosynthesis